MAHCIHKPRQMTDPDNHIQKDKNIRVKFVTKDEVRGFIRQLPADRIWGNCEYLFQQDEGNYDWVVVYDDLPSKRPGQNFLGEIPLRCPGKHTILVTMEPSNIKTYGRVFVEQFGYILTSQEPWALRHPRRIYSQPALRWFYGIGKESELGYQTLSQGTPPDKSGIISAVCSTKQQKHTLHHKRYTFVQEMKKRLPELNIYGHGVREMDDKLEALDSYKYHIVIENHYALHHWTEKLSDAFLGFTLPFYYGCPNACEYFPENSFIPIDIKDIEGSYEIIRNAIDNCEYEKRLPQIIEARRLVLEKYNLFAVLTDEINRHHQSGIKYEDNFILLSRRAARKKYPVRGILDLLEKARNQVRNLIKNLIE